MQISDPKAIRALAHPLRLDLLELLVAIGPATAARCGRILGVSQASCSFHLRQLAKYGFVADGGPGRDRRERLWRVSDPRITVRIEGGNDAVLRRQLERIVIEREMQAILNYAERPAADFAAWQHKAGIVTSVGVMSPEEVGEVKKQWLALLEPFAARALTSGPRLEPGQHHVRYFMAATPLPDLDLGDSDNASDD